MKIGYQLSLALICFFSVTQTQETSMHLTLPNYSKLMDDYFESLFTKDVSHQLRPYYKTVKRSFIKTFSGFSQINLNNPLYCINQIPSTFGAFLHMLPLMVKQPKEYLTTFYDIFGWHNLKCNPFALGGIVNQAMFALSVVSSNQIAANQNENGVFILWVAYAISQLFGEVSQSYLQLDFTSIAIQLDFYNIFYVLSKFPNIGLILAQVLFVG